MALLDVGVVAGQDTSSAEQERDRAQHHTVRCCCVGLLCWSSNPLVSLPQGSKLVACERDVCCLTSSKNSSAVPLMFVQQNKLNVKGGKIENTRVISAVFIPLARLQLLGGFFCLSRI